MRKAWRRLKYYARYDLKEIINPTSLPNPPEYVPPEKLTWGELVKVISDSAGYGSVDIGMRSQNDTESIGHKERQQKILGNLAA